MPDQDTGQTMSKKYELLTARYRSAAPPLQAAKPSMASHMLAQVLDTSCGSVLEPLGCHAACIRTITSNVQGLRPYPIGRRVVHASAGLLVWSVTQD